MSNNLSSSPQPNFELDPSLSKVVKQFLLSLDEKGLLTETLSTKEARDRFASIQSAFPVDLSGIVESKKTISGDGPDLLLNIVRPDGATGSLPVFLFIYGGGWVMGDYRTHKRLVRDLVVSTGFAAVTVNYAPSPEAQYPQALREIHTAGKWIAQHGKEIQVDRASIGIVGNDVGANMAAASVLMANANGGPDFKVQVLMCPVMNAGSDIGSWKKYNMQPFPSGRMIKWMWDQYMSNDDRRKEIYASPLLATAQQLKGFPPTLIQVAEMDISRDEGEAFGRALDNAGVIVTTVRYNGVIHDFGMLNGLAHSSQTKIFLLQAAAQLKKYLG